MYFIVKGLARVTVYDEGKKRLNVVKVLRKHYYFGEVALLTQLKRTATVTSITELQTLKLEREHFVEFCDRFPHVKALFLSVMRAYNDPAMEFIRDALHNIPWLRNADRQVIKWLSL